MLTAEDNVDQEVIPRLRAAGADLSRVRILKCIRSGALELITGVPGLGKSMVAQISLVAPVTTRLPWPDGTDSGEPANVDKDRQFLLGEDLDMLEKAVAEFCNVTLITIDPITAYMGGKIDSHRTTEVRSQLGPLKDLAEKLNVAISAITHPPKSGSQKAIDWFIGSQGFIAAARIGHVCVAEMDEDEDGDKIETGRVLFANVKNNPSERMPTLAFRRASVDLQQVSFPEPILRTSR
jgi:hypothetical protein